MSNPLVKISDYLDEVARIFVSQSFSTKYDTPIVYLMKELESCASRSNSFDSGEYEKALETIKDKITKRLEQGRWN